MKTLKLLLILWLVPVFAWGANPKTLQYIIFNNANDAYNATSIAMIKSQATQLYGKDYNVKFTDTSLSIKDTSTWTDAISAKNAQTYGQQLQGVLDPGADKVVVRMNAHAGDSSLDPMGYYGPNSTSSGPKGDASSGVGVYSDRADIIEETYKVAPTSTPLV